MTPTLIRGSDTEIEISIVDAPSPEQLAQLSAGLDRHAVPFVPGPGFLPMAVFASDQSGQLIAGAAGKVNWTWLDLELLWVESNHRGTGLGRRLLAAFEAEGVVRGCRTVHVSTFSFQAERFYLSQGYETFGSLPDYPPGHRRVYLHKPLTD